MRYLQKAIFVVLVVFLILPMVIAEDENQTKVDKAFEWLAHRVTVQWGNTEENAFSVMALEGYNYTLASKGVDNLLSKAKNGECWPSPSCTIKDTAIATIAFHELGKNLSAPKAWLLSQRGLFLEQGEWFLQFEIGENNGTCSVEYDTNKDTVSIKNDRTVSVGTSACLDVLAGKPWWAHIKSECLTKEFFISCENTEWLANILFIAEPVYVPFPEIRSPGHLQITSKCFPSTSGGSCDYDATLWASYALSLLGEDPQTKAFLEFGADARKPISYALIFLINGELDYAQKTADEQNPQGYWGGAEPFFNTAIAYLSQKGVAIADLEAAKSWLLKNQNSDYSWGSGQKHRDTAAVLYSVFTAAGGAPPVTTQKCEDFSGFVCCASSQVKTGAENFSRSCLPYFNKVCVRESDCVSAVVEEICGIDRGFCCEVASAGAITYPELDDTCSFGEVCASSCEVTGEERCGIDRGKCCVEAAIGARTYTGLDNTCSFGEICAESCKVTTIEDTCISKGYRCCEEAASGASRYYDYDDTCMAGEDCASECKIEKKSNFLTFMLWFLVILAVVAIIVVIFMLARKKKKKPETLPGLEGITGRGFGRPPSIPPRIPTFERPMTPRGPPIIPRRPMPPTRPGFGSNQPAQAGRISASPLRSRLPVAARPVRPIPTERRQAKPETKSTAKKKKSRSEEELEKTLKELERY